MSLPRRKTNPNLRAPLGQPPRAPEPPAPQRAEPGPDEDCVTCCLTGRRVRRSEAYEVKLGPGQTRWMSRELTSELDRRR